VLWLAGCHANGGNIVQAGKTLFLEDLQRFNVADQQSLYDIIYKGEPVFLQWCAFSTHACVRTGLQHAYVTNTWLK
jgi:hypothetical protein